MWSYVEQTKTINNVATNSAGQQELQYFEAALLDPSQTFSQLVDMTAKFWLTQSESTLLPASICEDFKRRAMRLTLSARRVKVDRHPLAGGAPLLSGDRTLGPVHAAPPEFSEPQLRDPLFAAQVVELARKGKGQGRGSQSRGKQAPAQREVLTSVNRSAASFGGGKSSSSALKRRGGSPSSSGSSY